MFEGIKRLLSSETGGEEIKGSGSRNNGEKKSSSFYQICKASNYEISVTIKGSCPYTSCILSAVAVSGTGDAKYPLAARHTWKKIFKSQELDLPCTADTLHLSPMDAGHYIKVEILPTEEPETYSEKSSVIFGPIVLDPAIKKNLQNVMRAGGGKFKIERLSLPEAEESGCIGQVLVNANTIIVSTATNPKVFLKLDLRDKFKLISQRTHLQTFMLDLGGDQYSNLLTTMFNLPRTKNFRRLKFTMDSSNKKDQLFVAINIFRNLLSLRDNDVRDTVNKFFKQDPKRAGVIEPGQKLPPVPSTPAEDSDDDSDLSDTEDPTSKARRLALKKQRIEHLGLKGGSSSGYKLMTFPDPLERLFLQDGMKEEIQSLYNHNKKIAEENNQLQKKMADLKISNSKGLWEEGASRHEVVEKTVDMSVLGDTNKIQIVNQKNQELEVYIRELEAKKENLKKEADRIAKLLKNIRYKELLESKLNATAHQAKMNQSQAGEQTLNNSNLQAAMEDYLREYRRIVDQMQPGIAASGIKQRSMLGPEENSLSMVDEMDDRTNHINMKNERLKEDIFRYKQTVYELESNLRKVGSGPGVGNASFLGNESFVARAPNRMRPEVKQEYESKIFQAEQKMKKLQKENAELTEQIVYLKKSHAEVDGESQQALVIRKLKNQQADLQKILESRKKRVRELMQERIRLTDKEMDMKEATKRVSDQELITSQKKLDTEKKLMLLNTELKALHKTEQFLDTQLSELADAGGANMSMVSQLSAKLADQGNIPGLRQTVALLQSRLSTLLSLGSPKSVHQSGFFDEGYMKSDPQAEMELQKQKNLQQKLLDEILRLGQETKKNEARIKELQGNDGNKTLMFS